ncbi:hypothetical protein [Paenibacillus sp. SYP-B4298]|uniref:hypothetical protein n=1 Tax=Paenibacillus sp. SYP-B4298 TaxID=2996034 RepID=UPI0022DE6E54|nr:hypothetical protein [Paenibacillus sp. SYP-B4298]
MMMRIVWWIGKWALAALVVSMLSVWTTAYIVNSYVGSFIKQYNLPVEPPKLALSGVWGSLWGGPAASGKQPSETAEEGAGAASKEASGGSQSGSTGGQRSEAGGADGADETVEDQASVGESAREAHSGAAGATNGESSNGTESTGDAAAQSAGEEEPPLSIEFGAGSGTKANSGATAADGASSSRGDGVPGVGEQELDGSDPLVLSADELVQTKGQISAEDKQKMFAIIAERLPQQAWQTISLYMEDGLTESELQDIQQIVAQHLNDEEYQSLMEILKKY